jgi:YjbE family integral membrane protein
VEAGLNPVAGLFDVSGTGAVFVQLVAGIHDPQFWVNLSKIVWINLLLSGDNALVVALACRALAPRQRFWGMVFGAAAAVVLRIAFTIIIATVMQMPYLKLAGGLALIVIAAKLLVPEREEGSGVRPASHLWSAVRIVVVADIVMSLDNVIAVAAAADGSIPLLIFGLASSIPLIIAGAALIMALLGVLPILIWAGAALLGWIAGEAIATDPAVHPKLQVFFEGALGMELDALLALLGVTPLFAGGDGGEIVCAVLGVMAVLLVGAIWRRRGLQQRTAAGKMPA